MKLLSFGDKDMSCGNFENVG